MMATGPPGVRALVNLKLARGLTVSMSTRPLAVGLWKPAGFVAVTVKVRGPLLKRLGTVSDVAVVRQTVAVAVELG